MDDIELNNCIKSYKKTKDNVYYEKIYRYFFQKIYRFVLLNISDNQAAEDITVDVFYKVYRYIIKVHLNSASFKPWIYKIARNLIIDYYRKEAKHKKNQSLEQYLEDKQSDGSEDVEKTDIFLIENNSAENRLDESVESEFTNQDLLKGLGSLPDIQKQVIILRFVEGLDYKSIGLIINKNELAVRAIKFRAISRLKELLNK
ncbi:MAG: RNA polymerase sigma factor [Actinobacteria bacterium]|nr:RNA polymerase sigma factor [Actinomycetota bacterium]